MRKEKTMEEIMSYVKPELLILVPVLYFIGAALKRSAVPDKWIPLSLGAAGVILAVLYVLATSPLDGWQSGAMAAFVALTQGILAAGLSVYVNQVAKQAGKEE